MKNAKGQNGTTGTQELEKNGQEKFASIIRTYIGNLKSVGKSWSDAALDDAKTQLAAWREIVQDGIAYINTLQTERAKAAALRYRLAVTANRMKLDDPEIYAMFVKKHALTEAELAEAAKASAPKTRAPKDSGAGHVIKDNTGAIRYRNSRTPFEVFRSYSKGQKTGHVGEGDRFSWAKFLEEVVGVAPSELRPGTSWTYNGITWTYTVVV